jgi:preprotein translocase subunit YajC
VHHNATLFLQNVPPKAGTPAAPVTAQESAPGAPAPAPVSSGGQQGQPPGMMSMLLPFLIFLPFLWLMFRRQKKEQAARAGLKKGDRVMTQAGLVGELMEMGEPTSKLKIAAGVTIEVMTNSLSSFPTPAAKKDDIKIDAKVATEKK